MPEPPPATPGSLDVRLALLEARLTALAADTHQHHHEIVQALHHLYDDDPRARRQLAALRTSADYAAAWTDPTPLVSVVIPTYTNTTALLERALPSALNQTHQHIEVIVVGDHAPARTTEAINKLGDPRVRYFNLPYNGPYPEDPHRAWLASGTPPYNAAVRHARGHWIAPLGDDDAFVTEHLQRLLSAARNTQAEYAYGQINQIMPDGSTSVLESFPPRLHRTGLQAAIYHRGLSFLELELGHATFWTPNDWGLIHRMLRIGVRMTQVDQVSTHYWASGRGHRPPDHNIITELQDQLTHAHHHEHDTLTQQLTATQAALAHAQAERDRHRAETVETQHRLEQLLASRSWRLTAALRALRATTTRSLRRPHTNHPRPPQPPR